MQNLGIFEIHKQMRQSFLDSCLPTLTMYVYIHVHMCGYALWMSGQADFILLQSLLHALLISVRVAQHSTHLNTLTMPPRPRHALVATLSSTTTEEGSDSALWIYNSVKWIRPSRQEENRERKWGADLILVSPCEKKKIGMTLMPSIGMNQTLRPRALESSSRGANNSLGDSGASTSDVSDANVKSKPPLQPVYDISQVLRPGLPVSVWNKTECLGQGHVWQCCSSSR